MGLDMVIMVAMWVWIWYGYGYDIGNYGIPATGLKRASAETLVSGK